jgi:iron(III) transport system substrate-binding protein
MLNGRYKIAWTSSLFAITFAFLISPGISQDTLTLYSERHYENDDVLIEQFEQENGIEVEVVRAGADELMARLKSEGEGTDADLFITADAGRLERASQADLLQSVDSETLTSRIPAHLRDPENEWFGFTKRARVLMYAPDRVEAEELSTYEALADDKWRGRVLARSSANIYNQSLLASIIAANGEEKAAEWAESVRKNMARPPQGSDRDQIRAVAAGLGDVAIANTYYMGLLANAEEAENREAAEKVAIFWPNQDGRGVHVNVSGGGVVRGSDNVDTAVKFLEFLVSDQAQQSFTTATYEYPVVEDVEWSEIQQSWGEFKEDSLNLSKLGDLNEEAVKIFNRAGWE